MYIAIDGDEIGKQLELLLFSNSVEQASSFSKFITEELSRLSSYFESEGCKVVFCGGDSILISAPSGFLINKSILTKNGTTWSVGIGEEPSQAVLALKKAKGLGRNRIEYFGFK